DIEDDVKIKGNRELLIRLVQNLVTNGIKYGIEGGYVLISVKNTEEGAELCVEDNGIGIPKEEQKKIFDRFYRVDASRSTPGTGLGLSMVEMIAQIHSASLSLDSSEGRGSRFRIMFPRIN
nr:sensor histidine kinase [Lachnospiraceae bacterium]